MGYILNYKQEIIRAMNMLAKDKRTIFLGQNVSYSGAVSIHESLSGISDSQRFEMPVAEDMQMGISIGLSLEGYIPVSIYPRMDFLILAANQLVNHLDKIEEMSQARFRPKVIIRTQLGVKRPLDPGLQHCQDHTAALRALLTNINVIRLDDAEAIMPSYGEAIRSDKSTVIIEIGEKLR